MAQKYYFLVENSLVVKILVFRRLQIGGTEFSIAQTTSVEAFQAPLYYDFGANFAQA